jgi:TPR repeat protein
VTVDLRKAARLSEQACDGGDGIGCGISGLLMKTTAQPGTKEHRRAQSRLEQGCKAGYQPACDAQKSADQGSN